MSYNEEAMPAQYTELPIPMFKGNPLIEALPVPEEAQSTYKKLLEKLQYDENQRNLPVIYRKDMLSQLYHFFQPWGVHLEIAEKIGRSIRSGYINRNPLDAEFYRELNRLADCVSMKDSSFSNLKRANSSATGFTIVGASGTGKSSAISQILNQLYPQKILHTSYKGVSFHHLQIVWMKLDCPFDGGVKGLCVNFFKEFDILTGDNTYMKFANSRAATIDSMLAQMALLAKRHSLGALVIDEIQYINFAKSGGKERMLNFLSNLMNTLNIPIILIGIPSAVAALSETFMNARRNTGEQGTVIMKNLPYDGGDWEILLKRLWRYQWTSVKTPLTEELSQTMYQYCEGNVALAVNLYHHVQIAAMDNGSHEGDEIITPELITEVAKSDDFHLTKAYLTESNTAPGKKRTRKSKEEIPWDYSAQNSIEEKQSKQKKPQPTFQPDESIPKWRDAEDPIEMMKAQNLIVTPDDEF